MGCPAANDDGELDVVWGLGSGRRARALLRGGRRVEVLAIDVDPQRPDLARTIVDACERLRDAYGAGRLVVRVGSPAAFAQRWHELGDSGNRVTIHVDLAALAAVPPSARDLARTIERLHVERLDLHRFAERMRDNLVHNLGAIAGAASLSAWTNAARGRPAFVLAAGPSARAAMPWLAQARELGPLIAVDTALPLCRDHDIPIDCLVSVDPHATSRVHLSRGTSDVHALAFQPYCTPHIVDAFSNRVIAMPTGDRLCDLVAAETDVPQLPVAGTVLLYALQIAAVLACDPVIVIGADFAHVGGFTHAIGTATAHAAGESGQWAVDNRGRPVPTSSSLLRFLGEVERHVGRASARHWAIDGGGARICGVRAVDPKAIERWVRRHSARATVPHALPLPHVANELGIARRRAIWQRLLGEVDGELMPPATSQRCELPI
jgi:hypothetical protein